MKLKYSASLALALWLCVVAWVSAMIVAKPSVANNFADGNESGEIVQLQRSINHNTAMLTALDLLDSAPDHAVAGPLVAPDPEPVAGSNGEIAAGTAVPIGNRLSLIISTERSRRAILDGRVVRDGTKLDDGSHVRSIGADWLRIENAAGDIETLQLPRPFAAASSQVQP
ncbi:MULTISPECIES: hypothetical protein [unclassified Lysobacter]